MSITNLRRSCVLSFTALLLTLSPLFGGFVGAAVNTVTPSTNDQNRSNGWAHVNQTAVSLTDMTLEFVQPRAFWACFEYRTDGDTSQQTDPTNYNPAVTDGLYPYKCENNSSSTMSFTPSEYVEVRMVFGAESDERFDWTRFDLLKDTTAPETAEFTTPSTGESVKGTVQIKANVGDSESGLGEQQITLRRTDNTLIGNWIYNVKTGNTRLLAGGGSISYSGDANSGTLTVTYDTNQTGEGQANLRLFTKDAEGNGRSNIYSNFVIDRTAPDPAYFTSPTTGSNENGNVTIEVFVSDTAGLGGQQIVMRDVDGIVIGNWSYNVDNDSSRLISGTGSISYTGNKYSGVVKVVFDSSTIADGRYNLRLFTKDRLGNGRSNIYNHFFTDNTAPLSTIVSPADGSAVSGQVELEGQVTDDNPMNSYFRIEGPNGYVKTSLFRDGRTNHMYSWDTTTGDDGEYTIYFETRDSVGNKDGSRSAPGNSVAVARVTVDNTSPVVDAGTNQAVEGLEATLNGTATDAQTSVVTEWTLSSAPLGETATFTDETSLNSDVTVTGYGTYTFRLQATDEAGNISTDLVTVEFTEPDNGVVLGTNTGTGGNNEEEQNNANNDDDNQNNEENNQNNQNLPNGNQNNEGEGQTLAAETDIVPQQSGEVTAEETQNESNEEENTNTEDNDFNFWWIVWLLLLSGGIGYWSFKN